MNIIKRTLSVAAALALTAALCSCQLSKILPQASDTTAPLITFTMPSENGSAAEPFDMASADLSSYVTLGNYKGLSATYAHTPLTDEQFESEMTAYLNGTAVYAKITDRAAAQGDTVIVDYVGTMNGVAFSGGSAQNQAVTISENSGYIPGFAEGLVGAVPGTTVEVPVTFPENYHADMAGKDAVFTFTVHYIRGDKLTPAQTDDYITQLTEGAFTKIDEFRAYYREYLDAVAQEEARSAALDALWSQAVDNATVHSLPEQQVTYYVEIYRAQYAQMAQAYGVSMEQLGVTEEYLRSNAEEMTKQDLVLYALAKAESITVTDELYRARLSELAAAYGESEATLAAYYGEDELRASFLFDEVRDMLFDNATITK